MKLFSFVFVFFMSGSLYAQHTIDSLLGDKGIFSKLVSRQIVPNGSLSFNLKLTIVSTAKKGSKNQSTMDLYLNTKDGYTGSDKSFPASDTLSPGKQGFHFFVETSGAQSFEYSNSSDAGKLFQKLSSNLVNNFKNVSIKKSEGATAVPRRMLNKSLAAIPYYVDVTGLQKKWQRYLYGLSYPLNGSYKSYLGSFGVGFYYIDNHTYLCVATENDLMKIEITKIEKVKVVFDAAGFKQTNHLK